MVLKIPLLWPVVHLSQELKGFDHVKFLEWHTLGPLNYALGNGPVLALQRGLELRTAEDIFIFKDRRRIETLLVEVR